MGQRMINKGGERVIHDTIQAIQEAEAKADAIVKDADEKAEAEEKRAAAVSEANAAAKQQLDAASDSAREGEAAFEAEISKEVEALKAVAKQREAQAVDAVMAGLL